MTMRATNLLRFRDTDESLEGGRCFWGCWRCCYLTEDKRVESDSGCCRLRQGSFSLSRQQQESRRENMLPEGQISITRRRWNKPPRFRRDETSQEEPSAHLWSLGSLTGNFQMSWSETSHLFLLFQPQMLKWSSRNRPRCCCSRRGRLVITRLIKMFLLHSCNVSIALGLRQSHLRHEICAELRSQQPSGSHFISFRLLDAKSLEWICITTIKTRYIIKHNQGAACGW